jgi:hypothetical protein
MAAVIVLVWIVGWLAAIQVLRSRAGVKTWGRIKVSGRDGYGVGWVMWSGLKSLFWPITLIVWLAMGRPEPRVVFNDKAVARSTKK